MPSKLFGLIWALQLTFAWCWWLYQVQRRYPAVDVFTVLGARTSWVGLVSFLVSGLVAVGCFVFGWPLAASVYPALGFLPLLFCLAGWGIPRKLTPITIRPVRGVFFTDAEQAMAVWRNQQVIDLANLVYPIAVQAGMPNSQELDNSNESNLDTFELYDQKRVLLVQVTGWLNNNQTANNEFVGDASMVVEYLRAVYREGTFFQRIVLLQNVFNKLNIPPTTTKAI